MKHILTFIIMISVAAFLTAAPPSSPKKGTSVSPEKSSTSNPQGLQKGNRSGPQDCSGNKNGKKQGLTSPGQGGKGGNSTKGHKTGPRDGSGKRHGKGKGSRKGASCQQNPGTSKGMNGGQKSIGNGSKPK